MLIKQEIPELNKIKVDNSPAPTVPAPPDLKKNP